MAVYGRNDDAANASMTSTGAVSQPQRGAFRRTWLPTIRFGLLCLALWLGLRVAAPSYAIEGESMLPTFHDGGRVILNGAYRFQTADYGDVIVFNPPYDSDKPYIKRIIGLAGDRIEIHDGYVYRNGMLLDEPYIHGAPTTCYHEPHCLLTVPDGMLYVLGDNRPNSSDSRIFGLVDEDAILGKVLFSFWPLDDIR